MPRDDRHLIDRLADAVEAADSILEWTTGRSFDDYLRDKLFRSAVERQFMLLGEALGAADKQDRTLRSRIPELGNIVGTRNAIAHGYFAIDDTVIWSVANELLVATRTRIQAVLESEEHQDRGDR